VPIHEISGREASIEGNKSNRSQTALQPVYLANWCVAQKNLHQQFRKAPVAEIFAEAYTASPRASAAALRIAEMLAL
jgi:hypothetical protein